MRNFVSYYWAFYHWTQREPLVVSAIFLTSLTASFYIENSFSLGIKILTILEFLFILYIWKKSPKTLALFTAISGLFLAYHLPGMLKQADFSEKLNNSSTPIEIQGVIYRVSENQESSWAWIKIQHARQKENNHWQKRSWQGIQLELRGWKDFPSSPPPQIGQKIHAQILPIVAFKKLSPWDFDRSSWLEQNGIFGQAQLIKAPKILESSKSNAFLPYIENWLAQKIELALSFGNCGTPDEQAVAKAVVLGKTKDASPELLENYRQSGTLHAFAVSGMNVGMLALIFGFLFKTLKFPPTLTLIFIGIGISLYALSTGLSISALRAALMGVLVIFAFLVRWNISLPARIALAVLILLFLNPLVIFNAGFQLSFLVVAALIYFSPKLTHLMGIFILSDELIPRKEWSNTREFFHWLRELCQSGIIASFIAWLAAAPIIFAHFGAIYPMGILASFFIMPLVFGIMALALLSVFLSWIWPAGIGFLLNNSLMQLCSWLTEIASIFAHFPGSVISVNNHLNENTILIPALSYGSHCALLEGGKILLDAGKFSDGEHKLDPCLNWYAATPEILILSDSTPAQLAGASRLTEKWNILKIYSHWPILTPQNSLSPRWKGHFSDQKTYFTPSKASLTCFKNSSLQTKYSTFLYSKNKTNILFLANTSPNELAHLITRPELQAKVVIFYPNSKNEVPPLWFLEKIGAKHLILQSDWGIFSIPYDQRHEWEMHKISFWQTSRHGSLVISLENDIEIKQLNPN